MKFLYQKNTKTLNQVLQDFEDFRFKEITRVLPSENCTIIDFS